jgi:hypothetical protein
MSGILTAASFQSASRSLRRSTYASSASDTFGCASNYVKQTGSGNAFDSFALISFTVT